MTFVLVTVLPVCVDATVLDVDGVWVCPTRGLPLAGPVGVVGKRDLVFVVVFVSTPPPSPTTPAEIVGTRRLVLIIVFISGRGGPLIGPAGVVSTRILVLMILFVVSNDFVCRVCEEPVQGLWRQRHLRAPAGEEHVQRLWW